MTDDYANSSAAAEPTGPTDAPSASQQVGTFQFLFAEERWVWSPGVARIHGYPPAEMTVSTELLLSHKHPEDREHVAVALSRSVAHGEPFSSSHRIVDTHGNTHHVIVVADTLTDENDKVIGSTGYYIDLTATLAEHRQETLHDTLPELFAARAVIEQAKGALMLVYGVNAEQAFRVLTWRSQETNTKLRALAEQLVTEMRSLAGNAHPLRTEFDHLLLTVHERVAAV